MPQWQMADHEGLAWYEWCRAESPLSSARDYMAAAQSGSMKSQLGAALDVQPIAPASRIASIDIVRGLALFGVMAINVVTEFRVSIFQQFLSARVDRTWFDRVLYSILMVGIDLKAFALFSLLFGVEIGRASCRERA